MVEGAVSFAVLEAGILDDIDGDHTVLEGAPLERLTADGSEVETRPPHFDWLMNRSFCTGSAMAGRFVRLAEAALLDSAVNERSGGQNHGRYDRARTQRRTE